MEVFVSITASTTFCYKLYSSDKNWNTRFEGAIQNIITMDEKSHKEDATSKMASHEIARENMIETAVKFLVNPRVVQSSISHKTYFLKKKEEAFSKLVEVVNSLDRSIKVLESSMTSFKCRLEEYCSKLDSLSDSSNLNKRWHSHRLTRYSIFAATPSSQNMTLQFPPTPSLNPGIPSWQQVQQIKESDNAIDDSGSSADSNESSPKSSEKNLNSKPEEKNSKFQDNNSSDNGSYVCVDELSEEN
ncbi:hypothetical protein GQR58_026529 [Nymphon striatum]|nr:hypothetical protein GQR58_026529 [Nymphon striatum]